MAANNSHSLDLEAGSSQYAEIIDASQTGLDITGDLSIGCWVKIETAPVSLFYAMATKYNNLSRSWIFDYHDGNGDGTETLRLIISADGSSNTSIAEVNHDLGTSTWHHVAVKYDASAGSAEFFVDGASKGSVGSLTTSIFNSTAPFRIGANETGSGMANFFDGLIDEVVVTNTDAVTWSSVYNKIPSTSLIQGAQGIWRLNNDYTDISGNSNTLTASGSPVFSTDAQDLIAGAGQVIIF